MSNFNVVVTLLYVGSTLGVKNTKEERSKVIPGMKTIGGARFTIVLDKSK